MHDGTTERALSGGKKMCARSCLAKDGAYMILIESLEKTGKTKRMFVLRFVGHYCGKFMEKICLKAP